MNIIDEIFVNKLRALELKTGGAIRAADGLGISLNNFKRLRDLNAGDPVDFLDLRIFRRVRKLLIDDSIDYVVNGDPDDLIPQGGNKNHTKRYRSNSPHRWGTGYEPDQEEILEKLDYVIRMKGFRSQSEIDEYCGISSFRDQITLYYDYDNPLDDSTYRSIRDAMFEISNAYDEIRYFSQFCMFDFNRAALARAQSEHWYMLSIIEDLPGLTEINNGEIINNVRSLEDAMEYYESKIEGDKNALKKVKDDLENLKSTVNEIYKSSVENQNEKSSTERDDNKIWDAIQELREKLNSL